MTSARLLLSIGAAAMLSGCVAVAAVPVGYAAMVGKNKLADKRRAKKAARAKAEAPAGAMVANAVLIPGMTMLPPPDGAGAELPSPIASGKVPAGMQFLYGSGEAVALSYQAYLGLIDLMIARSSDRAVGQKVFSVVLTPEATLAAPQYLPCGTKPLAVVFDVDETALLNVGFEADDSQRGGPYDQSRWDRWERTGVAAVIATPGMVEVARVAKASGVTLVFNTNRMAANAGQTEAALTGAGLGPVEHGRNLWLQGDVAPGGAKDARRQAIAAKYCVIAMAGDQLGDFSDLFNAPGTDPFQRRTIASANAIKIMWGHGWFILPNPVYGSALKGDLDAVFPRDKRWTDPGPAPVPPSAPAPAPSAELKP